MPDLSQQKYQAAKAAYLQLDKEHSALIARVGTLPEPDSDAMRAMPKAKRAEVERHYRAWADYRATHGNAYPLDPAADNIDAPEKFVEWLGEARAMLDAHKAWADQRNAWHTPGKRSTDRIYAALRIAERLGIDRDPAPDRELTYAEEYAWLDRLLLATRKRTTPTPTWSAWMTRKDMAAHLGISVKTLGRRIEAELYEVQKDSRQRLRINLKRGLSEAQRKEFPR